MKEHVLFDPSIYRLTPYQSDRAIVQWQAFYIGGECHLCNDDQIDFRIRYENKVYWVCYNCLDMLYANPYRYKLVEIEW